MKKVMVLIENLFDEQELIYPYHRLREDFEVHLVGAERGEIYTGKSGLRLKSTHASSEVSAEDYEGVVIPGGFSPDYMRKTEATKELVREFDRLGKPVAAICHGPWMMASCCNIKGKNITSTSTIKDDLVNAGANWINQEVVVDGHIITSRTPLDLPVFIKAFLTAIK